jgi:pimeloyl-ACP methyl ester carboxylesterase
MGGSDHPNDFDKDKFSWDKCNSYFVDYLEKWRLAMKNSRTITELLGIGSDEEFTKFFLCGHSFGGYQVGNYALKYP